MGSEMCIRDSIRGRSGLKSEEERDMCTQLEHDESFPDRSQNWVRRNGFGCVHFLSSEGPADDELYKYALNRSVSDASISSE